MGTKLKWMRRIVAGAVLLTFFAGFLGRIPVHSMFPGGVPSLQFVPSLLGSWHGRPGAWAILLALLLLTLLFGRVYCSWLCPLGILQDITYRLRHPRIRRLKGASIRYTPHHWLIRLSFALLAFGMLLCGSLVGLSWLDPYTILSRFGAGIVRPMAETLSLPSDGSWAGGDWTRYDPWLLLLICISVAIPLLMSLWKGRLYCNTICPVGALLGFLSRWAPLTPRVERTRCGHCANCMRHCKAHAIDLKNMKVDVTRCVGCYDCLSACSNGAMKLGFPAFRHREKKKTTSPSPPDTSRRSFLAWGAFSLASAALPEKRQQQLSTQPGILGNNTASVAVPPGAGSVGRFLNSCTGCGLCISACPTHVLRPSLLVHGWSGMMKPWLDYTKASCRFNCHTCSTVCPEGALLPLSLQQKKKTQIALVQFEQSSCLVWKRGEACAQCASACPTHAITAERVSVPFIDSASCRSCQRCMRVCPHGAIQMVKVEGRERSVAVVERSKCIGCGACVEACRFGVIRPSILQAPHLDSPLCIGCGACVQACPASPKAMSVTPRAQHLQAEEYEEDDVWEWDE